MQCILIAYRQEEFHLAFHKKLLGAHLTGESLVFTSLRKAVGQHNSYFGITAGFKNLSL